MSAVDEDSALGPSYETSATLISSESTSLHSSSSGDIMAGPPPPGANSESTMSKPKLPGVRQRVTVVCAECKRLKLRCDRRTPCSSCLKRDTIDKCIYHQAATEKIDLQSLNNRILTLEHKTASLPDPAVPSGKPTDAINPGLAASAKYHYGPSGTGTNDERPSTLLALGAHGASVAINLDGPTGLWVDDLGFDMSTGDAPSSGEGTSETSGISLQPVTSIPDAGLLDFLSNFTQYFRLPCSSSGTGVDDEFDSPHDDDENQHIGVTPQAVFKLPPAHIRAQIYPRLEAAHVMSPCVNFIQFRRRVESMFLWAEVASGLNSGDSRSAALCGEDEDIQPMLSAPTLSFYAATAAALAMGAQCWLFERDLGWTPEGNASSNSASKSNHASPIPALGMASSPMPPPISASEGYRPSSARIGTILPVLITDALPYTLYRMAKLALFLSTERAGYQSLDLDYVYAKTVVARLFLLAHSGPTNSSYSLLTASPTRKTARPRKSVKMKDRSSVDPGSSGTSGVDTSMSEDVGHGSSSRKADSKAREKEPLQVLALDPDLNGLVGELVANSRLMGLSMDPDIAGGNKLSLYEKEMRRRLWWEVVSIDSFVSDCVGQHPLINIQECSTRLPADVDEELFGPESKNLPAPNIETLHGNIEYYIRKLGLLQLNKDIKKRLECLKYLNPKMSPSEELNHLSPMLEEFKDWLADLPEYLQIKEIPLPITQSLSSLQVSDSSPPDRPPLSPDAMSVTSAFANEGNGLSNRTSPFVIAMQCDLVIQANYYILRAMLPLVKEPSDAMTIIGTWTYLHSIFKHIRPSMFMCYSFTRNLFDASVTLAHLTLRQPMIAASTLPSLESAVQVLNDPSVLTGRPSAANSGNLPSEAVRIVEALIQKVHNSRRGSNAGPAGAKRKHEEIDATVVHLNNFKLPYVGAGVICSAPRAAGTNGHFVIPHNPPDNTSNGSSTTRKTKDPTSSRTVRTKKSPVRKDAPSAPLILTEQGPPAARQKTVQNGQITVRKRLVKKAEPGRARTGSITATSGAERPSSSVPPTPIAPLGPPAPAPQAPQVVVTHSRHAQQDAAVAFYSQAQQIASQPVESFTLPPHTSTPPDFATSTAFRNENLYPAAMSYPHSQAYTDHHRAPLSVPSQSQHGPVNFDGFPGASSVPTSSSQVRNHQSFTAAATGLEYTVTAPHQPELDLSGHASRSEAHYQGRGSIDHGTPAAPMQPQSHQYPQQMQVSQQIPSREQGPQPWTDNPTYGDWNYAS